MTMSALPPGFQLMRVKEGEVELCPGVSLAGASRVPHGVELPLGVMYCFRKKDAPLHKGIKRLPYHMAGLPEVKGCVPLLLPASLQLIEGVRLILGAKLPLNTVLPPNVMIVQRDAVAIANGLIPKGMTEVQLSTVLKTPANFRMPPGMKKGNNGEPSSLILVQMHTTVALPRGCKVAVGCEIAKNPDDVILPHGVQLIRCSDECVELPSFMTPLDVYTGVPSDIVSNHTTDAAMTALMNCKDEMALHRCMDETCTIMRKPNKYVYGLGVELVLSLGPGQWMGSLPPSGMRPLTIEQYPPGLSPSALYKLIPPEMLSISRANSVSNGGGGSVSNTARRSLGKVTQQPSAKGLSLANSAPQLSARGLNLTKDAPQLSARGLGLGLDLAKDRDRIQRVAQLVQLSPRFDFPDGATPFPGWEVSISLQSFVLTLLLVLMFFW